MSYELVIVGAGITGLRAAILAYKLGVKDVLIVDYEKNRGGFGSKLFDRPEFADEKKLIEMSDELPYEFWFQSTVVGFFAGEEGENHQLSVQTPLGTRDIDARKVLLCSGSLEKPREAHMIPGSRPAGVMTPYMVSGLLERGFLPGNDCIVIENSKFAKTIANVLAEKGIKVKRIPGETSKITNVKGNARVSEVEITDLKTDETYSYPCDTLIFSKGRIPCTFYLKGTRVDLDDKQFIITNDEGKTNIPGIGALGSCTNRASQFDVFSQKTTEIIQKFIAD